MSASGMTNAERTAYRAQSICLNRQELLLGHKFFLLDAGFFANEVTQVEQPRTTHFTALEHLDINDIGSRQRKNTLYAHTVRHLAHRESTRAFVSADLYNITAESLYALFIAFDDFVVDYYVVARKKFREVPLGRHLFMYKLDRIH